MAFCKCGCGRETSSPKINNPNWGTIKGKPNKFIHGHNKASKLAKDWTGHKFGMWTAIKRHKKKKGQDNRIRWLCQCECGKETVRLLTNMKAGQNTGCGCQNPRRKRPFEALYNMFVNTSRRRGRTRGIMAFKTFLLFTLIPDCHYCGVALNWQPYYSNNSGYKLDRKDNSKGYTKSNCVPCCARCNRSKSDNFTYEEWLQIGQLIKLMRLAA